MVNSVGTVVLKVAELFLMIGVGVVCARMGMLTRRGVSQLPSLLLYIVAPCLIVASLSGQHDDIEPADLGLAFGLAIGAHLLAIESVSCCFPDSRTGPGGCCGLQRSIPIPDLWDFRWYRRS